MTTAEKYYQKLFQNHQQKYAGMWIPGNLKTSNV